MTATALAIVAVSLVAAGEKVPSHPVSINVVAVDARREGHKYQTFGPGLETVRHALTKLDYDAFRCMQTTNIQVAFGQERQILTDRKYTLFIMPVSVMDDGRIRLRARIEIRTREGRPTNALNTTLQIPPGSHLNLGGLRIASGELIFVVSAREERPTRSDRATPPPSTRYR